MANKRVEVSPAQDGHDLQQNWMVRVDGKMKSHHVKKSAAKRKAREYASDGDTLIVKGTNGQILQGYPRTVRDASAGDSSDSEESSGIGIPGLGQSDYGQGTFETGVGDFFK